MYDKATEFFIPRAADIEKISPNLSKISLGPLDRGFGYTLGNALRRVMLSSMPGYAITGVRIEGVGYEYDIHEGIQEDILEVLLNLKQVAIRLHSESRAVLQLKSAAGSDVIRASDIKLTEDAEIFNPDLVIAHLADGGSFSAELHIERGRGYIMAEQQLNQDKSETTAIDLIRLDASYSPITRAGFKVEDTRRGNRTDHDMLIIELETNGSIDPDEALRRAATILYQHLTPLVEPDAGDGRIEIEEPETTVDPFLLQPVQKLELSSRVGNALKRVGILSVGDLVQLRERDLYNIPNIGKRTMEEIISCLSEHGLQLGTEIPNWSTVANTQDYSG